MSVVPDLLPELHPSFDLRINFPERPPEDVRLRTRVKRKYEKVEPGVFLLSEQVRSTFRTIPFVPDRSCASDAKVAHALHDCVPYRYTSIYHAYGGFGYVFQSIYVLLIQLVCRCSRPGESVVPTLPSLASVSDPALPAVGLDC